MKLFTRILSTMLVAVALVGWVACDDGGTEGTDTNQPTDVIQDTTPVDNGGTDEGPRPDVPVVTDEGKVDVPVVTDIPVVTDEGPVDVGPCVKDCGDRVCGESNCAGESCGTCGVDTVCNEMLGVCQDTCDWATDKPTSWGPTAAISALQTPADAAVVKATCFDYTNDGNGDNGLKGLAGQVNGPLADAVNGGDIAILFELVGVTDFANTASFQLNGLLGASTATPPATSGDFYVDESAYITETCLPMIYFPGAKIAAGALTAGPSEFRLSIPIQEGLVIDATLIQAQIKGTVKNGDAATGFEIETGVLSGVLTKEQLETAINNLQATCDAAPANAKPDYCSYLTVAKSAMALLFDLHQNGDGTFSAKSKELPGDAASVCLAFSNSKAKVIGFAPAAP